jgi:hypothetical protein
MGKLWYESGALASTVDAFRRMNHRRKFGRMAAHSTRHIAGALLVGGVAFASATGAGCAGSGKAGAGTESAPATALEAPGARDANLAGARCAGGPHAPCTCRNRLSDPAETSPPDADHKRFEIRLGAEGGGATFDSPTLGHLTAGATESCFYIDVLPGTTSDVVFTARETRHEGGISPMLDIAEYGPKGPWWYDVLQVRCASGSMNCNRDAAEAWSKEARTRKRGRIDPCGSAVISHLEWDTSGGTGARELGLFRDFTVKFTMEVKRFPTQFPPRSTECVPK